MKLVDFICYISNYFTHLSYNLIVTVADSQPTNKFATANYPRESTEVDTHLTLALHKSFVYIVTLCILLNCFFLFCS